MKILSLFALYITLLSCKAQQVLPLNGSVVNSPINSYFKDINNELDFYVGNWKANFQNKTMILKITKALHRPFEMLDKNYFQDQLIIRYEIKDINESVLQTTLNRSFTDQNDVKLLIESSGTESNGDIVNLLFAGGNCSVGIGEIILKKINNTQFYWSYYPGTTTRNDITCPPNLDYNIYLPETENLIFTKQ
ncbi:DUF6705 family protein [Chryseobacterium sp. SL1]|uniref:DUF6705 family protein n=1 Tax=Chryseobacterium sp. SL1 TaxID=2995159 RepID=UPI0022757C44|nr:DUF6705 family protein [Chryseobacterium sp. SL1]MCY1661415.1 hypothetical protein [Chryseobacterium sp. SL1]